MQNFMNESYSAKPLNFGAVRYQNFSSRSEQLHRAAQAGGWVLENHDPQGEFPFWVARHPNAQGRSPRAAWSMMHGNEPTGFAALCALMASGEPHCDWTLIPLVNPSGIDQFTRLTATGVDLNRCARRSGPREADLLKDVLQSQPFRLALNLHDQRSLFHPKGSSLPSSLSVLAPRARTPHGETVPVEAQEWAGWISSSMSRREPSWGYARFDDEYYPEAFGEWCQELGLPTVTVETGVALGDYARFGVAQQLGAVLMELDQVHRPQAHCLYHYQTLPLNAATGVDVLLSDGDAESYWKFEEEVQDRAYRCSLVRVVPSEGAEVHVYRRAVCAPDEYRIRTARDRWTSEELYASTSEALRSFAAGLPK
jgi:hypothetical protein